MPAGRLDLCSEATPAGSRCTLLDHPGAMPTSTPRGRGRVHFGRLAQPWRAPHENGNCSGGGRSPVADGDDRRERRIQASSIPRSLLVRAVRMERSIRALSQSARLGDTRRMLHGRRRRPVHALQLWRRQALILRCLEGARDGHRPSRLALGRRRVDPSERRGGGIRRSAAACAHRVATKPH